MRLAHESSGMSSSRTRPLPVGPIRAFEAVARLLSFRGAGEELHLTQSAVSRQISALEDELGATLFLRGTRHVELTSDGATLLRAVAPALDRLDASVRQIRVGRGRRVVSVTTFASFSSLWLIPRLEEFQRSHEDIDIRVSATDKVVGLEEPDLDLALRYSTAERAPAGAIRLFDETLTPVIGRWLLERVASGEAPPLNGPADLVLHTLAEEESQVPGAATLSWRHWLAVQGQPGLEPRRWMVFNFTHQQLQAALTGQAIALGRLPLVAEALARGELVEPFGRGGRLASDRTYWLVPSAVGQSRPEVAEFARWVLSQAELTRTAMAAESAVVKS
jgi:LysR family glycine cleavage system transcriptional activator